MEVTEASPFPVHREESIDDETSSANTEVQLLSSKNSSETINCSNAETTCCQFESKKKKRWGPWPRFISGLVLTCMGVSSVVWTPFEVLMTERLRMTPGLPPYEWWKNPPDEVLLRVYVFNITNAEEFLNGTNSKLQLQEVGPIVFREKLVHKNVTFNENGTLSYVAKRTAIYLPEMNSIDLNQTLVLPNLAILGMASYLWDSSFLTKLGFNILIRTLQSEVTVKRTINDYLWNYTDPILDVAQTIAPSLVPVKNMGILNRIYSNFEDLVTVYVGSAYGHERYFKIDRYDGSEYLPGYGSNCEDKLVNATEGVAYNQFLTKNSTLLYWRKTICQVTPLYYEKTIRKYGVDAYRFILPENTYDRIFPTYSDCYIGDPPLPNGLSDVSKCYFDFPVAASFPHFLHGDNAIHDFVDGLNPDVEQHESFVIVEPVTGIPMESRARSQSNLVVRKVSGFSDLIDKFSDITIPMFWAEYNQVGLPWYIASLMYFTVVVLPYFQVVMSAVFFVAGLTLVVTSLRKFESRRHLEKNKRIFFSGFSFGPQKSKL